MLILKISKKLGLLALDLHYRLHEKRSNAIEKKVKLVEARKSNRRSLMEQEITDARQRWVDGVHSDESEIRELSNLY